MFALDTQSENNSIVAVSLVDGLIVIKPISSKQWSLEQLLANGTEDNIHQEVNSGKAAGNEIWQDYECSTETGRCCLAPIQSASRACAGRKPSGVSFIAGKLKQ